MHLINIDTYLLEEFADCSLVEYAILSHRWEEEEISYDDLVLANGKPQRLKPYKAYYKFRKSCKEAAQRGIQYVWIDTCCIDRASSAELQEAINSMFHWYASAAICFVYMSDVHYSQDHYSFSESFSTSQWFKRGWTLQELLAPRKVAFFDDKWTLINYRKKIAPQLSTITGIPEHFLKLAFDPSNTPKPCIAEVMSWASRRETTRVEDRAYSLLGLFGMNMPIIYGEGEKAFYRLQCELLKYTEDQSIFAWDQYPADASGLLATSPDNFADNSVSPLWQVDFAMARRSSINVHNEGIDLEVKLVCIAPRTYIALLNMVFPKLVFREDVIEVRMDSSRQPHEVVGIFLRRIDESGRYARIPGAYVGADHDIVQKMDDKGMAAIRKITVVHRLTQSEREKCEVIHEPEFFLSSTSGIPDHWRVWLDLGVIEITGSSQDVNGQYLTSEEISMKRQTVCIKSKEISHRRTDTFPFANIVLGYDFDFNPVMILSTGRPSISRSRSPSNAITDVILRRPSSPYPTSLDVPSSPSLALSRRSPSITRNFTVDFCHGCTYRILNDQEVAFTLNSEDYETSISSRSANLNQSPDIIKISLRLLDTERDVYLALSRPRGKEAQWNVHIDLDHADPISFFRSVDEDSRGARRTTVRYKSITER